MNNAWHIFMFLSTDTWRCFDVSSTSEGENYVLTTSFRRLLGCWDLLQMFLCYAFYVLPGMGKNWHVIDFEFNSGGMFSDKEAVKSFLVDNGYLSTYVTDALLGSSINITNVRHSGIMCNYTTYIILFISCQFVCFVFVCLLVFAACLFVFFFFF